MMVFRLYPKIRIHGPLLVAAESINDALIRRRKFVKSMPGIRNIACSDLRSDGS